MNSHDHDYFLIINPSTFVLLLNLQANVIVMMGEAHVDVTWR